MYYPIIMIFFLNIIKITRGFVTEEAYQGNDRSFLLCDRKLQISIFSGAHSLYYVKYKSKKVNIEWLNSFHIFHQCGLYIVNCCPVTFAFW